MKQITITRGLKRKPDANEEGTPTSVEDGVSTLNQVDEPYPHPIVLLLQTQREQKKVEPVTAQVVSAN